MKLSLETSVANFLFAEDAPEKRYFTELMFDEIKRKRHDAFVSDIYTEEVLACPSADLRAMLEAVVKVYALEVVNTSEEALELTRAYIQAQAFTEANYNDALHVAIAAVNGSDAVVSWNFRHIVRAWTMKKVGEVNHARGLTEVVICTPQKVVFDAEGS